MIDKTTIEQMGYHHVRQLPDGRWIGLRDMIYTSGLFVGIDDFFYEYRYCYRHKLEAVEAILQWNGSGDPPGPWIVCKGRLGGDIPGPGART